MAGVVGQLDGTEVELAGLLRLAYALQVLPGRGIGVGGDNVDTGLYIEVVHGADRGRMAFQGRGGPGVGGDGHAHGLQLRADGPVQEDYLTVPKSFLESCIVAHRGASLCHAERSL